jgi:hypothetical protein
MINILKLFLQDAGAGSRPARIVRIVRLVRMVRILKLYKVQRDRHNLADQVGTCCHVVLPFFSVIAAANYCSFEGPT